MGALHHFGEEYYAYIPAFMGVCFVVAMVLRMAIWVLLKCVLQFGLEFEKRVHKYLAESDRDEQPTSFHLALRQLLDSTYQDHFEMRRKHHRRRLDSVTVAADKLFLVREGVVRLIDDTLAQSLHLKKGGRSPRFLEIAKFVLSTNPTFSRLCGILPTGATNEVLRVLPGLFLSLGSVGALLGFRYGMPRLAQMGAGEVQAMIAPLAPLAGHVTHSLECAIAGIILASGMALFNALFAPEVLYIDVVHHFSGCLEYLWNETVSNESAERDRPSKSDRRRMHYSNESWNHPGKATRAKAPAARRPVVQDAPVAVTPAVSVQTSPRTSAVARVWNVLRGVAKATAEGIASQNTAAATDPNAPLEELPAFPATITETPAPRMQRITPVTAVEEEPEAPTGEWEVPPRVDDDELEPTASGVDAPVAPLEDSVGHVGVHGSNEPSAPAADGTLTSEEPAAELSLEALRAELKSLDEGIKVAYEQKLHGQLPEEQWREKSRQWLSDREAVLRKIGRLSPETAKNSRAA